MQLKNPLKCPKCRFTAIKLIKERVPQVILNQYPEGLCRKCKKVSILELKKLYKVEKDIIK